MGSSVANSGQGNDYEALPELCVEHTAFSEQASGGVYQAGHRFCGWVRGATGSLVCDSSGGFEGAIFDSDLSEGMQARAV